MKTKRFEQHSNGRKLEKNDMIFLNLTYACWLVVYGRHSCSPVNHRGDKHLLVYNFAMQIVRYDLTLQQLFTRTIPLLLTVSRRRAVTDNCDTKRGKQ
jgi:hypothetical protein